MNASPSRGDVIWASMDPTVGREQAKHRPWLVLSEPPLHRARGLVIAVPLTHTDRGWITHVNLTPTEASPTVAMCEQVKSMSMSRITKVEATRFSTDLLNQVHELLSMLTGGR